jgi:putative SbcD/Mre11-related phosphoesterase
MPIRFINNKPTLLISDRQHGKILAIADLHLGIEHELYNTGITIAPQAEKFQKEIEKLIKTTKADKLVILGDLKHKVPGISFRELKELPKLVDFLKERVHVVLVCGNHDVGLKEISEGIEVHGSRGFSIGPYGFFHGHAWPGKRLLKCDHLFTAHIHPVVEFVDDLGFRFVEKVWMKGEIKKRNLREKYKIKKSDKFEFGKMDTIIFPSFNPIISGVPLNSKRKKNYIGPLLSSGAFDIRKAEAFMLDGTALGEIRKIKSR